MAERGSAAAGTGLVVGALVALGFAIVIRLLPEWLFLKTHWRIGVYALCAAAAPPTVWFLQWVARVRGLDQRQVFSWAAAGAMTFDGLAIGFIPDLYGQTGQALAWTASALIFAFASLLIAGQIMLGRTASPAGLQR
ncbi:MAG: hypothetical protein FGM50_03335 [Mycobacterium sp.]|nr:hypothetical protein [Mycobacterium sp.]